MAISTSAVAHLIDEGENLVRLERQLAQGLSAQKFSIYSELDS